MHRTRRTLRIRRISIRQASTAAKPAPRLLGKWERPHPPDSQDIPQDRLDPSGSSAIRSRDWSRRTYPGASTGSSEIGKWDVPPNRTDSASAQGSTSYAPGFNKWARSQTNTFSKSPEASSSGTRRSPAPHQYRREDAPHKPGRESAPHQSAFSARTTRSTTFASPIAREPAPHQAGAVRVLPPLSPPRPNATKGSASSQAPLLASRPSLGHILNKDRIKAAMSNRDAQSEEELLGTEDMLEDGEKVLDALQDTTASVSTVAEDIQVQQSLDVKHNERVRLRNDNQGRRDFKERGSILGRLGRDDDLAISTRPHSLGRVDKQNLKEREKKKQSAKRAKPITLDIFIPTMVSVRNLAKLLNVRLETLRRTMIKVGMDAEASYDHMLTEEYASLLAMEFNRNPVVNDEAAFDIYPLPAHPDPSSLPARPPVVTIMGHVDHGKTTLLDTLRSTSVAKGEAGGITQHIGAFSVPVGKGGDARTITFLDTPGHAAFSAMRARGASVTDIVVLVVAADDGIMPQTREVIELVQKEKVGLVVAINKIDKPGADLEKVEQALLAEGIQLETFGGDVPSVHVSGLTGQGLDQLVETISAVAEVQDIRAEREGNIQGYVLESRVQKGLGPVATVLVLRGHLKPSDHLIAGLSHAKVRLLTDSSGKAVKAAYPGMAVTVSGWKELPKAGDEVLQGTESDIKKALANRERKVEIEANLTDMEAINEQRRIGREQKGREVEAQAVDTEIPDAASTSNQETGLKELKLIIKADVSGSAEAVAGALSGIGNNIARVKIVATGVGDVAESDVTRAKAVGGMVVAFSVNIPRIVQTAAASQQVSLLSSTIIYRLMEEVKEHVIALLPRTIEKRVSGEANVLQLFDIQLKAKVTKKIAGCRVTNGVVDKKKLARVIRNGNTVYEGRLETLKHLRRDITEASKGTECGIGFEGFDDLREGDLIQIYQEVEKPGSL